MKNDVMISEARLSALVRPMVTDLVERREAVACGRHQATGTE
jgi:hypothetical protein